MSLINPGHFLMGCRLDNWLRLMRQNGALIAPEKIAQTALITLASVGLAPVAAAEKLVFDRRIRAMPMEKDPIFVLGHWRSGTTYFQNMLSRDPQFGWADPVHTVVQPYSLLLPGVLRSAVEKGIAGGRPMDNVQYAMDLPMEETFALLSINDHDIIHMMAFPANYQKYISGIFVEDLPTAECRRWERDYRYILDKFNYIHGGKQLVLKSPDNTGRVRVLWGMYPRAKFINIHRDPYRTIVSFVRMLMTQMDLLHLTAIPDNVEELIEDVIMGIFERMYRELFELECFFPTEQYADVEYADFCAAPVETLERLYGQLGLEGFAEARPYFRAYAASQKSYRKNDFSISPRLVSKINRRLGFYLEHYHYRRMEADQ